jgi:hypothetical protein
MDKIEEKLLFNYWDNLGKENIFLDEYELSLKMLDIHPTSDIERSFIRWFGGMHKLLEYYRVLEGKKIKAERNGYSFYVTLSDFNAAILDTDVECHCSTDYEGEIMVNGKVYNIHDVINDEWESDYEQDGMLDFIRWEIRDIANELTSDKIPCGFLITCVDVSFSD